MPNNLQVDQVVAAMLQLATDQLSAMYEEAVDVAEIGDKDFTDDGDLILVPTSVRIRFMQADYSPTRDNMQLTYDGGLQFGLLVYEQNLRSRADERQGTLRLAGVVQDCFVGARLTLENGARTGPITMLSVLPMMNEGGVIDQYYAVMVRVPGIAQFPGTNSNLGGR